MWNRDKHGDESNLNWIQEKAIGVYINDPPTLAEVTSSISKLNMEKATGKNNPSVW